MTEIMLHLPGLSLVNGKALSTQVDGGVMSSGVGLLAVRDVEQRLDVDGGWRPASMIRSTNLDGTRAITMPAWPTIEGERLA